MSEHCMINGERCSKCCEVIITGITKKRFKNRVNFKPLGSIQTQNKLMLDMIRPISKRRAKKKNELLVSHVKNYIGKVGYFTCKHFNGSGCSNYENRPYICSGFPFYGNEPHGEPIYNEDCTYFIEVK